MGCKCHDRMSNPHSAAGNIRTRTRLLIHDLHCCDLLMSEGLSNSGFELTLVFLCLCCSVGGRFSQVGFFLAWMGNHKEQWEKDNVAYPLWWWDHEWSTEQHPEGARSHVGGRFIKWDRKKEERVGSRRQKEEGEEEDWKGRRVGLNEAETYRIGCWMDGRGEKNRNS